jgi:predicted Zn finger-like uncharacterized protein
VTASAHTTCPHCDSSLPVATDQLQQADGRVRCGNCLQVFHAPTGDMDFVPPTVSVSTESPSLADITISAKSDTQQHTAPNFLSFAILTLLILLLAAQLYTRLDSSISQRHMDIRQLIVRKHPELPNALRVDAILGNPGDESRQLPALDLLFSNHLGEPVAQRSFIPREYLHGVDGDISELPAHSEIQISLQLQNPGPDAATYSGSLRSVSD